MAVVGQTRMHQGGVRVGDRIMELCSGWEQDRGRRPIRRRCFEWGRGGNDAGTDRTEKMSKIAGWGVHLVGMRWGRHVWSDMADMSRQPHIRPYIGCVGSNPNSPDKRETFGPSGRPRLNRSSSIRQIFCFSVLGKSKPLDHKRSAAFTDPARRLDTKLGSDRTVFLSTRIRPSERLFSAW